jgi:hypothetical protein
MSFPPLWCCHMSMLLSEWVSEFSLVLVLVPFPSPTSSDVLRPPPARLKEPSSCLACTSLLGDCGTRRHVYLWTWINYEATLICSPPPFSYRSWS